MHTYLFKDKFRGYLAMFTYFALTTVAVNNCRKKGLCKQALRKNKTT